jgi:hypothetical protein
MKLEIAARLLIGAFVALGFAFGGALLGAAPASAQEATPWYMPQPWMHPPQTGPKIRKLPGYYGHNYRNRTYGSFGRGCYGDCGYVRGTISSGYGVIYSRPVVAIFDPKIYGIVQRQDYAPRQQPATTQRRAILPANPAVVSVRYPQKPGEKARPNFEVQHGVRIIRPTQLPNS